MESIIQVMVRDRLRETDHFLSDIDSRIKSHERRLTKIFHGSVPEGRLTVVQQQMADNLWLKAYSHYSAGLKIEDLTNDFKEILELMEQSWAGGSRKFVGAGAKVLDQYNIDAHIQVSGLLSIGFLCGQPESFFQRLGDIIKSDNIIDTVFEFILSSKLEGQKMMPENTTYQFKLYSNLKSAIAANDKQEAERFLQVFLDKDWLREQKKAQMLTEPDKDWYYGRWSFESAAVVAIKELDDSSFRDNPYYPKDLVDYYRSNV